MEPQQRLHLYDNPYPHHYVRRPRSVEPMEPNLTLVLEELRRMDVFLGEIESHLGEKIEGRCGALKKRVLDGEQCSEERFISQEMFHTEMESECAEMDKQFRGLKLEVNCINRFLERENMAHAQGKPDILTIDESASTHPTSNPFADGPEGHRVDNIPQEREYGSVFTHTHIPANGTSQTKLISHTLESSHEHLGGHQLGIQFRVVSYSFQCFWERIHSFGSLGLRITLSCMGSESSIWGQSGIYAYGWCGGTLAAVHRASHQVRNMGPILLLDP
jgi:hypothetical protein